jgi:hypothetical protein
VLVPSELDSIHCRDAGAIGPPACPAAHVCVREVCEACGAEDFCGDGIDNDCNGGVDDLGCATNDGGSESGAVDSGDSSVPDAVGQTCTADADCDATSFCGDATLLGAQGERFCTRGCCSSEECGSSGAVCVATSGGAALCVPAARAGRSAQGSGPSGSPCQSDADCRSGWCGGNEGVCLDACCRNTDCASTAAPDCTTRSVPGVAYPMFACGAGPGSRAYQDLCFGSSSCRSGVCLGGLSSYCSAPCCSTNDCGGTYECVYATYGTSKLRLCDRTGVEGTGDIGEVCAQDSDCRSTWCLTLPSGEQMCTDACCHDMDCLDSSRFACRPAQSDLDWILRCEPR